MPQGRIAVPTSKTSDKTPDKTSDVTPDKTRARGPEPGSGAADAPRFEAALEELEALVERMESGALSLDDSLAAFERGIHLTRECQRALSAAEQRVQVLMEQDDGTLQTHAAAIGDDDPR